MESKFPPSLYDDPEYYTRAWHICGVARGNFGTFPKWVETAFGEAVIGKLQIKLDGQEPLRVLGMGSGSGKADVSMLTSLLKRFPNINNRVVEPAKDPLDQYKALVQTKAHDLHGVVCDWRQQTIDQYEKAGDLTKFHFVHAIESIYYAANVDDSLMYLYNRMAPGGVLLVTTISDDSSICRLWSRFPMSELLCSADVRRSFESRNIPYTQYHQASYLDITQCFDETSEDGRMLVDMITHVLKFQETAPEDQKVGVMEYLASIDCSEKRADGRIMFNVDWDAVVVCKPLE